MSTGMDDAGNEAVFGETIKKGVEQALGSETVKNAIQEKAVVVVVTTVVKDCIVKKGDT